MPNTLTYTLWDSPAGTLILGSAGQGLARLVLPTDSPDAALEALKAEWDGDLTRDDEAHPQAVAQLHEYFNGRRRTFDLELDLQGTDFQLRVWTALAEIPFGKTRTYGQIAEHLDQPQAMRAVGGANHANPVPIIVPCHRVIGADGGLTGFGGGLPLKKALLDWEQEVLRHEIPSLFDPPDLDLYWPGWRRRMAGVGGDTDAPVPY